MKKWVNSTLKSTNPPVQSSMVALYSPLSHDLFKIAIRHWKTDVEPDRIQDHVFRKLASLEIHHHNLRRPSSRVKSKTTTKSTQITKTLRQNRKRRLHPIDILIEFSGFAVGALTCELAGESRASSL